LTTEKGHYEYVDNAASTVLLKLTGQHTPKSLMAKMFPKGVKIPMVVGSFGIATSPLGIVYPLVVRVKVLKGVKAVSEPEDVAMAT